MLKILFFLIIFLTFGCRTSIYSGHELPSNSITIHFGKDYYINTKDWFSVFVDSTDKSTWIQERGYYSEHHTKINNNEYSMLISETNRINCLDKIGKDSTFYIEIDIWKNRQHIARYKFNTFFQIKEYIIMMENLFGRELYLPHFPKEKYLNYEE